MKTLLLKIKAKNLLFFITLFLGFFILNSCKQNEEEIKTSALNTSQTNLVTYKYRLRFLNDKNGKKIELFTLKEKNKNPFLEFKANTFFLKICNTYKGNLNLKNRVYYPNPKITKYQSNIIFEKKTLLNCPASSTFLDLIKYLAIDSNLIETLKNNSEAYYDTTFSDSEVLLLVSKNGSAAYFVRE